MSPTPDLLVLLGPTASGKTRLAVAAARALGGEIISADSRQVFRGLDLGSGKDLAEYGEVPYHLIDIRDPGEPFSVFDFQREAWAALAAIRARRRLPIVCGGTGLYLDALLRDYQLLEVPENPELRAALAPLSDDELRRRLLVLRPAQHNATDLQQRERLLRAIEIASAPPPATPPPRPAFNALVCGLEWPREVLRQRIATRLQERLRLGLLDEVRTLQAAGVSWTTLEGYGLEYRMVALHLQGRLNRNDMTQKLTAAIGDFAKRQSTWFRRMERQGVVIHWLDPSGDPLAQLLARWQGAHGQT